MTDRGLGAGAFGERWGTPADAAALVADGSHIASGLIEPTTLLSALAERQVGGTALIAVMAMGGLVLAQAGRFRIRTGFATPVSRALLEQGACEYLPLTFADAERHMNDAEPDCVLVRLSPPDEQGRCSYGWAAGYTPDLVDVARRRELPILAEIDASMPRTRSGREVPIEAIARACPADGDPASDLDPLVPDGATLQVGIGSVPDAAVERLGASDLGIHTEVLGGGLARLLLKGRATGRRKARDRETAVCTIASVDPDVRAAIEDTGRVEVRSASEVLDPRRIAEHDRLRCINSAIAVDLRGQVNAETFGREQVAGVGGQLDFLRGAGLRGDALRIIALASTTSSGISRIVAGHPEGSVITATRYDVDAVVTEHGVAHLRDRTDEERARALIAIAHPDHRRDLERARFARPSA
jgi:4-hydroxybutyrate CoA-transferase